MKAHFVKIGAGLLMVADESTREYLDKRAIGSGIKAEISGARNIRFHRKFFGLLRLAFDTWVPEADVAVKNFEKFRSDVLVLAGFYDVVCALDGGVKTVAQSLSFANMDEEEFSRVYELVLDVVWDRIFQHCHYTSRGEVDEVVARFLEFQ